MRNLRALFFVFLVISLSCSRLVVKKPPVNANQQSAAEEWIPCTDVYFGPAADAALMASALIFMAFAITERDDLALVVGGVFFVPLSVVAGVSGVRGAESVTACRKLHRIYEQTPASVPASSPSP